jgi:hypothetical protein
MPLVLLEKGDESSAFRGANPRTKYVPFCEVMHSNPSRADGSLEAGNTALAARAASGAPKHFTNTSKRVP